MRREREFTNWQRLPVYTPNARSLIPVETLQSTIDTLHAQREGKMVMLEFHPTEAVAQTGDFSAEWVIANDVLISQLANAESRQRGPLTREQVVRLALANTDGCVRDGFSPNALNDLARVFYGRYSGEFGSKMVTSYPLQKALTHFIATQVNGASVRVKELGAGAEVYRRWQGIETQLPEDKRVEVVITDFSPDTLPNPAKVQFETGRVTLTGEQYDLTEPMESLVPEKRFNIMLASYAFDSVWQEGDITLVKFTEQDSQFQRRERWYQEFYRLRVHDRWPLREELLAALRGEPVTADFEKIDFNRVELERILVPFRPENDQTGREIQRHYSKHTMVRFTYPAGIIRRVEEAFDNQLVDDGIFIIMDVATNQSDGRTVGPDGQLGFPTKLFDKLTTGEFQSAAFHKLENFYLAAKILRACGFDVEVVPVNQFIEQNAEEQDDFGPNNWAMIVRKA